MPNILELLGLRKPSTRLPHQNSQQLPQIARINSSAPAAKARTPRILGPDVVGIVGFNDYGFVIAPLTNLHAPSWPERIGSMERLVRGMRTNIADGLMVAIRLLKSTPMGMLRRLWLLSDGRPNPDGPQERDRIMALARQARDHWININTIGFGETGNFDAALLKRIAARTHNGHYISVNTPKRLAAVLKHTTSQHLIKPSRHAEATVYVIDCSGSMVLEPMGNRKKITVVADTLRQLMYHKQKLFT